MKMNSFLLVAIAVVCAITLTSAFVACTSKNDVVHEISSNSYIVIDLDSIVIEPYTTFGVSLADVEKYMSDNYIDYSDENPNSLINYDFEDGPAWAKIYGKGTNKIGFYFDNDKGNALKLVSYDFFFPVLLDPIMAELERNGFTNKGEIRFDDFNADISYLFLSSDERIEAMVSSWEKDGGSWAITFQPTNDYDLQHLVNK